MTGPSRAGPSRAGTPRARRMLRPGRVLPADRGRPLYARTLRLRHINPGGVLCFLYLEGALAAAVLLALAEQVSWWAVAVLPLTVAAMVKLNDVVAGALTGGSGRADRPASSRRQKSGQW